MRRRRGALRGRRIPDIPPWRPGSRGRGRARRSRVLFRRRCSRVPSAYRRSSFASCCRSSTSFRERPPPRKKRAGRRRSASGLSTSGDFCRRIRGRSSFPAGSTGYSWGSSPWRRGTRWPTLREGRSAGGNLPRPSRRTRRWKARSGASSGASAAPSCTRTVFSPGCRRDTPPPPGPRVGIFGQAGDLFESLIKRAAGVKDSGTILPGHGGILDRADGILAAGPVLYLFAALSSLAGAGA